MIFIDDTDIGNYKIAEMIKRNNLEDKTVFFLDFREPFASEMINKLSDMGFQIGSHTLTHPHLTKLNDKELKSELEDSKKAIEFITKKECVILAYPYGEFDERVVNAVKKAGYLYARTCEKKDDGDLKLGSLELLREKEYNRAKKHELKRYHIHWKNIEDGGMYKEFEEFLKWHKTQI